MGMRMREHSRYVPFIVTKCYQTAEDWLQNDSLTVAGSAPNLERKTAQKTLFVQEIRPLGTSYPPLQMGCKASSEAVLNSFFRFR